MGGAQPLATTMNEGTFLAADVDESRIQKRIETKYCDLLLTDIDEAIDTALEWKENNTGNFFDDYPYVDMLVHQEGEYTVKQIFEAFTKDKDYSKWQRNNFDSVLEFTHKIGNQTQSINTKDIDLTESTDKLIAVTLKEKKSNIK